MPVEVAVFARAPGNGKTRLAASIGVERAAALSRAFLVDTLRTTDAITSTRVWAASDDDARVLRGLLEREVFVQRGADLGERMRAVMPAIIVGSDAPSLPARLIRSAIAALERHDFVLGPSADGGYYLFGARAAVPSLEGVRWSTRFALEDTRAALGGSCALLAPWFDVDTAEDLRLLGAHLALRPRAAPETARVLTLR
jgi:rSAM/selenodomain-associated transferase 1